MKLYFYNNQKNNLYYIDIHVMMASVVYLKITNIVYT